MIEAGLTNAGASAPPQPFSGRAGEKNAPASGFAAGLGRQGSMKSEGSGRVRDNMGYKY
jgi:hypothetical protein